MTALENLKTELAALRDEAKVQAHLGSMEVQQEWQEGYLQIQYHTDII